MIFFNNTPFLPQGAKTFFKRSFQESLGLCLVILMIWFSLSIWGYSPFDPSLNTATQNAVSNWMGLPGAIASDLLLQSFGLASFMFLSIACIWGWRLMRNQTRSLSILRFFLSIIATFLFGMVLIAIPFFTHDAQVIQGSSNWSKIPCVGGVFSYLLLLNWQRLLYQFHLNAALKPSIVLMLIGSLTLAWYSTGLSFQQLFKAMRGIYKGFIWLAMACGKGFQQGYSLTNTFTHKRKNKNSFMGEDNFETVISEESNLFAQEMFSDDSADFDDNIAMEDFETLDSPSFVESDKADQIFSKTKRTSSRKEFEVPQSVLLSGEYHLPPIDLLDHASSKSTVKTVPQDVLESSAKQLESVLEEFGIRGEIVNIRPGPVVTMYELKPAPGIKTSRVIGLADDIARSMSALSARIAVIPGQNVIGIELPNPYRQTVYLKELLASTDYQQTKQNLPLILGKDIGGQPIIADLVRMPHLLVAGTTGSGKSVSINTMILSLLFKFSPDQCKFIMIDPKMLELSVYDEIPHLLAPVVTDPKKAVIALKWAVREMENRYRAMAKLGVRNIDGFNARLIEARQTGEILIRRIQTGFDPETGKPIFENQTLDFEALPYIVVVVDEMADLMLVAGKEIEGAVQRLAQMARAAGIHLIMATQRPSVDVITGTIKANFPTRISFQVTSKIDSRTILGEQGAEQLLGQGDMLHMAGGGRISRVHGPFVKDDEVERIVKYLKIQGEPNYIESITEDDEQVAAPASDGGGDELYRQALELVLREGKVSTSFVQRHLQIGYNRAARIVEQMEKEGVISSANHVGKREILQR
ncbi:MAG: DNA translocase FtsK 4TM domain-containing protein [Alphaproteobacteria bacterium]|nr:DNA translocase FtsK 4TM domain-containing protein [Alphaproteobacteria bacterium]